MIKLKGLLYRKLKGEKEKVEESFPAFTIEKPKPFELPLPTDPKKLDVTYPLIEPYARAEIKWNEKEKILYYYVIEPKLTEEEKNILEKISNGLIELTEVGLSSMKSTPEAIEYLTKLANTVIKQLNLKFSKESYLKIMYYVYRNFVGLNEIEPLMQDPNIEDISCDGVGIPVYIIHRKYGSMKTNVVFNDPEVLRQFVIKLAERCGRYVSYAEPILDATLPDGSRVAATLATDVATRGATFTIRKFTEEPFSPVHQLELKTASSQMLAYLWYMVEHRASILVIGGTATGKTSMLNSISMFIQPTAKIVSIEDTKELRLPHEHWISGLARVGFGVPTATGEKYGEVTLFDLLRESFRQNPDYVIVGETRGEEAYVMFQGMASGHASMSTFHAGSVEGALKRLTSPPINLSPTLLESLDIVITMAYAREKGKSARRVKEITEIVSVDPRTGEVKTNVVYKWDPVKDTFVKVGESFKLARIASERGVTVKSIEEEISRRAKLLEWMLKNGIKRYLEVSKIIAEYYLDPIKVCKMIEEGPLKEERKEERRKYTIESILEALGFKVIRERL
jgi:flagellar protein FlaI